MNVVASHQDASRGAYDIPYSELRAYFAEQYSKYAYIQIVCSREALEAGCTRALYSRL